MKRTLLLLLPVVLLAVSAVVLLALPLFRAEVPTHEEWLDAARHVEEHWRQGDVVRIEPGWLTAGRVYFGDVDGGRREPLRILDVHDPVDQAWLYRFKRLWLVSAVGEENNYQEVVPPGASLVAEYPLGAVSLMLFDLPQGVVRWQLTGSLKSAVMQRMGPSGEPTTCLYKGKALRCRLKSHLDAKVELRRVAGSARKCLVVRPGPGEALTTLRFPGLHGPGRLLVRLGNTVEAARAKHGGDVQATVTVGGETLSEWTIERRAYRLDEVSHLLDQGEKELVISLSSTDDRKREICVDGYLLDDLVVDQGPGH
jgi:hypothetical protein